MLSYDEFLMRTNKPEIVHNLFNMFPMGMMIFEKITQNSNVDFELKYINDTALKVFRKLNTKSEEDLRKTLKKFNKLEKFSTINEVYSIMNDLSEENLYNRIFDNFDQDETEICERYVSKEIMIYVKIKIYQEYKLVSVENFNDERIAIQNNIIKNIKTQYLLTLSHELNNPLNYLAHSVKEIASTKEATKALMNSMKINIRLIKFFIKNFIFSLKMSLKMSTIIQNEKNEEKKKEDCINLEYAFERIREKYAIFFRSKNVKLECNFKPITNIYVKYNYEYFNSMIKNIFMYLFYRVEAIGGVKIEIIFENEVKIIFKKNPNNFLNINSQQQVNRLDTSFVREINIESSVQTIIILNEIIHKFAKMLGIRLSIIEDESPIYLIISLKYEIDEDLTQTDQDLDEEFTSRESKRLNVIQLDRSISLCPKTERKNIKNLLRRSGKFNSSKCVNEPTMISSSDFWNMSKISPCSSNKERKADINQGNLLFKGSMIQSPKSDQSLRLSDKDLTRPLNLKYTVSMTPDNYSDVFKKLTPNSRYKKMVIRSKLSFKYTNHKNVEIELNNMNCLAVCEESDNIKSKKFILNQYAFNKNDIKDDLPVKNKHITESSKYKNINTNSSKVIAYNYPGSINSKKIKKSFSRSSKQPAITQILGISKFKESGDKLSPNTNQLTKGHQDINNSPDNDLELDKSHQNKINSSSDIKHPDILVVDDDSFNLDVLQSMLKNLKLNCDTCMNGLECLNILQNKYAIGIEYKLILMDVMMPLMNGIEASNKIEELIKNGKLNKNLKIVIISAHNNSEIINNATKLSVVAEFLQKPVKKASIQRVISEYYNSSLN